MLSHGIWALIILMHSDTQLDKRNTVYQNVEGGARLLRPLWIRHCGCGECIHTCTCTYARVREPALRKFARASLCDVMTSTAFCPCACFLLHNKTHLKSLYHTCILARVDITIPENQDVDPNNVPSAGAQGNVETGDQSKGKGRGEGKGHARQVSFSQQEGRSPVPGVECGLPIWGAYLSAS